MIEWFRICSENRHSQPPSMRAGDDRRPGVSPIGRLLLGTSDMEPALSRELCRLRQDIEQDPADATLVSRLSAGLSQELRAFLRQRGVCAEDMLAQLGQRARTLRRAAEIGLRASALGNIYASHVNGAPQQLLSALLDSSGHRQ